MTSTQKSILVADHEAGGRLDRVLAAHVGELSRTRLKGLIEAGSATIDGSTIRDPAHRVNSGAAIRLDIPPPAPAKPTAEPIPLAVVYEDADIIVIDKPKGMVVHPAAGNWTGTLVNALIAHCGDSLSGIGGERRPGIVHRLTRIDRPHGGGEERSRAPVPGVRAHPVWRQLHRHAHRAVDRHLRAGHHQPVRLLHLDLPVAGRQADHRRPVHAAGAHVLGRGSADRGADVHAVDQRGLLAAAVGYAIGAGAWLGCRGGRGRSAATAVVVVSDDTESEATDRPSLNLPSAQDELISAVAAANPHTVVVINAGAPVAMPWLSSVAGVVDAWYPGQTSGTSLASVLFGQTDPGGHLPVTFPSSLSQVPAATPPSSRGTARPSSTPRASTWGTAGMTRTV